MKRHKTPVKPAFTNSSRENLPLLRGMFVAPKSTRRRKVEKRQDLFPGHSDALEGTVSTDLVHRLVLKTSGSCCMADDGLYLTAEEGYFLGRYE